MVNACGLPQSVVRSQKAALHRCCQLADGWEQLKSIDKMHDELGGDLSNLVILHDTERWKGLPIVKELEGFRIVKVA
jgi:hypothetical protein